MYLHRVLPILGLLLGARASSLDLRDPVPHRLDVRDTPDVCATINLAFPVVGGIVQCLCLSEIPLFVESNVVAIAAVRFLGSTSMVTDMFTNAIVTAAAKCVYPEHSISACVGGDSRKTCGFTCIDGFSPSPASNPTTCTCNAPSVICNGQCVGAGACPSSQALRKKRSWVGSGSCTDMGPGWMACGVLGGGPRAWECINAARDLESCGGCAYPLTAYSPIGKDCTTLPGVADVSCLGGECVVHRCLPGYVPASDGMSCIRKHELSQPQFVHAKDVPVRVYGLEHVPLGRY